ncbi:BTAD domain-containing putative transcriptional regulator [Streptomyces sp. NPDC048057]|uniref:ATP-binding protein n=1 Tax=Streptomyces sp. NPDC048057 TaxID=3155628 RepID=UPI0033D01D9D
MTTDLTLLSRVAHRGQEVTAPLLRGLLALLAADLRRGCSTDRLVAGLWPDALPERPAKALQVLVSRARAHLGPDVLVTTPVGYRLALAEERVDSSALLLHAAASADRAGAGDHAAALAAAEAGLALWEDAPGDTGDSGDPVAELRAARAPVRDELVRTRALALARLGRHAQAAGPLALAAADRPRDEEVLAELLRCEAATAGPSAALTRFETYRRELRDQLGTDPGPALGAVQQELLRGTAPVGRYGVPHEPNPLLGRDADVAAVEELLDASRAVTVLGPGGLGKTRLAHAVSRRAGQRLVRCVPLAGVGADGDVAAEVAAALGAGEGRHRTADLLPGILRALGPGPVLLVLDNCEHVVRGAADLVRTLLAAVEDLRVLTTSRAPLDLTSEAVYALPELAHDTAVELFAQRARAARPGVALPPDAVAEVCRHLDGLPLAVELAAARVRVLSVPEVARRIGDRFALLRGGARDAPARHRTLHAVVEWSWNLLAPDARAALRTLSVFPGGFCAEAAEHVLGGHALSLVEQLAGQSLLTVVDGPAGVRFRMLETIREFSAARRTEAGEDATAVDRFLCWARDFGVAHHDVLFGPEPLAAWERIGAEQDNLVLALRHALARADGPTTAAVTAVLAALWTTDSNHPRLAALAADTGRPLSHHRPGPEHVDVARTAAVLCAASLLMGYRPHAGAVRQLVTLRRLPPAPPDTLLRATAMVLGAVPEMVPPGYDVLHGLCASDQPMVAGVAEYVASHVWEDAHDVERALASAHRTTAVLASVPHPSVQVMTYARLGDMGLHAERGEAAYKHLKAALEALPRLGDEQDAIGIRRGLALACLQRGAWDEAERWLLLAEGDGSPDFGGRAELALARGQVEDGLALWLSAAEQVTAADAGLDPWALQVQSVAVTAHAYAGRLDRVGEMVDRLRSGLDALLSGPSATPGELPVAGTVLHALGVARLSAGDTRGVRMVALAERLRVLREFQPTMSSARARRAAEEADGAAYSEAVSAYAALERHELREAARALIAGRGRTTTSTRTSRPRSGPGTKRG